MGFSRVAVCNPQNNTAGLSVSSGQIDVMLAKVKVMPSKNLLSDVIPQFIRGIQKVE